MAQTPGESLTHFEDLEERAWQDMRRVILTASGGGLAISFLIFQIEGGPQLSELPWAWSLLLAALIFAGGSYGFRLVFLRVHAAHVRNLRAKSEAGGPGAAPNLVVVPGGYWTVLETLERGSVIIAGILTLAAFAALILSGFSLREAVISPH